MNLNSCRSQHVPRAAQFLLSLLRRGQAGFSTGGKNCVSSLGKAWCWLLLLLVATPALAAPPVPTGLTVTDTTNSQVSLSWNASSGATSYKLRRGTSFSGWTVVANQSGRTFNDTTVSQGVTYYYTVSAVNSSGESAVSTQVAASPPFAQMTGLTATAGNGQVALGWNGYPNTQGYRIRCGTSPGNFTMERTRDKWGAYYTWTGLTPYTTYYFEVQAIAQHPAGDSPYTTSVSATPYGIPASSPANLTATPGNAQVALTWNSVTGATSYRVKRSTNSGGTYTQIATPNSTSYTDSSVTNGVTYYYVVSAANSYGESSNSGQISATPQIPAPGIPGTPSISNIAATSLTSTAPILPTNATSLTLQKKLASQNDTFYTDVATGLAALAVTNVTNLTAETEYTFRYVAVGSGGSVAGNGVSATTLAAIPDAPTVLSALAGNGVVDLSWQAANGAITYRVERSTVTEGPYSLVADDIDELTYSDTTVTNGTTYYYVVRGVNGGGNGPASNEASATPQVPAPAVPGAPTFSNIVQTSVKVTAPVLPSGAVSLTLQKKLASDPDGSYANVATGLAAVAETTATLLSANTTYSFRYVAVNAGGSTVGSSANVTTLPNAPAAPQNLDATPGDGEVDLTWEASSGAVTYAVHRSTIEGGPYTEIEDGLTATSFNDDDVTNGTTYYYVVTAINTGGSSANSGEASATPQVAAPAAPSAPSFGNITNTSVSVTMPTLPARAESLILQRKETGAGDETYVEVGEDPQAEDVVSVGSLSPATGYTFRVIAVNAGGSTAGTPDNMTTLPNAPAKPENLIATAGNAKIDLSWDAVSGATSYTVKRSLVANGPYSTIISNLSGTTYADTPLTNGVTQYYVVVAVNSGGSSPASDEASATPQVPAPAAPDAPTFSDITQTSVKVKAPELPAGAVTLTLQRKLASEQDSAYSNVTTGLAGEAETTVTLLTANTAYSFRYIAVNAGGSTVGTPDNVTTLPNAPAKPEDLDATPGDGKVDLTWSASAGAVSYTVHYGTTLGGPYTEHESAGANTEFTHTPATNGTTYYYVVTATNTGGTSAASDEANAMPQVAAPGKPSVPSFSNITQTGVTVTLPALPAGADTLTLQRKETGANDSTYTNVIAEQEGAQLVSGGSLDPATGYTFRVIAVNAGGSTIGDPVGMVTLPNAPGKPLNLSAEGGNAQVSLSWNAVTGTTQYYVKRSLSDGGPYSVIPGTITTTTFVDTGRTNGTTYYYVVSAVNAGGESVDSDQASATPQATAPAKPSLPTFSNITATSVLVTMPVLPAYADSLRLERKETGAGDETYVEVGTNPQPQEAVPSLGLDPATGYTFRVIATNVVGSTVGNPASMVTLPNPPAKPENLVAVAGDGKVDLAWSASAGAVSYTVHYGTTLGGPYTVQASAGTNTEFTHTPATNGTTYYYVVTATNTGGASAPSDEAEATPQVIVLPGGPDAPMFSYIGSNSLRATAPQLPANAVSMTLQRKLTSAAPTAFANIEGETSLQGGAVSDVYGLNAATSYDFRYIAFNENGNTVGTSASVITLAAPPGRPNAPSFSAVGNDSVTVLLPAFPVNTTSLILQKKLTVGPDIYTDVEDGLAATSSYVVSGLLPNTSYAFRVVAVGAGGTSNSLPASIITGQDLVQAPLAPAAPTFSNIYYTTLTVEGVQLPTGASSLTLQKKLVTESDWQYVDVASGIGAYESTNVKELVSGAQYDFRFIAVGAGGRTVGDSDMVQTQVGGTTPAPIFFEVKARSATLNLAGLSWRLLQMKPADQSDAWYQNVEFVFDDMTRYKVSNLSPLTSYTFRYLDVDAGVPGPSTTITTTAIPAPPEIPEAPIFNNIRAYFMDVEDAELPVRADELRLQFKKENEPDINYQYKDTVWLGGDITQVQELSPATTYVFRYVAINEGGETPGPTTTVTTNSVITPDAPGAPVLSNITQTSIDITSPTLPLGADILFLERKQEGEPDDYFYLVEEFEAEETKTVNDLEIGTMYVFRFVAFNTETSTIGPTASGRTLVPSGFVGVPGGPEFSNIGISSLTVTMPSLPFNANHMVLQYKLNWESNTAFTTVNGTWSGGAVLPPLTGLEAGGSYHFRVEAIGDDGSSIGPIAGVDLDVPAPTAPGIPSFDEIKPNSVKVIAPAIIDGFTEALTLQGKLAGQGDDEYRTIATPIWSEAATLVSGLNPGETYSFRYLAVGSGGTTAGLSANVTLPAPTLTWGSGSAISCAGIRTPENNATIRAGTKGTLKSFLATDWDQRTYSLSGNTFTELYSDPCSYTWATSGGSFFGGRNTGQSVEWVAPETPGTYTITLTVDDQNSANATVSESGSRNDASKGYNEEPAKFSITVTVVP